MADPVKDLEAILKDYYHGEHERRDKLNASLTLPTAIVTGLTGVAFYFARNLPPPSASLAAILFFIFFGFFASFLLASIYMLALAYHDEAPYAFIADPDAIHQYHRQLMASLILPGGEPDLAAVSEEMTDFMTSQYAQTSQINFKYNDRKSARLYVARQVLMAGLISFFLSLFPYYFCMKHGARAEAPASEGRALRDRPGAIRSVSPASRPGEDRLR